LEGLFVDFGDCGVFYEGVDKLGLKLNIYEVVG